MPGEANLDLAGFVWTVYDDLDSLIFMKESLLLPTETREDDDDWQNLASFVARLADAWSGVMGTRDEFIYLILGLNEEELSAVGLTGTELDSKLRIWRRARAMLDRALSEDGRDPVEGFGDEIPPDGVAPERKVRRFLRFVRAKTICKWTSRALGHADTVMGSLIKLLPQGERLKEIKETVEKLTGELAEDLPD